MIIIQKQDINHNKINNTYSFKGAAVLNGLAKASDLFIRSQENLSSTRFIQDTTTNWVPKAIFARSKADFAEMSFLEFIESAIFYFALPILGEKVFRNKIFNKFTPENIRNKVNEQIPNSLGHITKNRLLSNEIKRRAVSTKAGILLACAAIPVAEYTLSFAKNLFTLKFFKKSNFNSIANLNNVGVEEENKIHQEKLEKHSKKQFKKAALISLGGLVSGIFLALKGHKYDLLQKISKGIINPGEALVKILKIKNEKTAKTLSSFSLDFKNNNGKLALGKGQLALTAIVGLFGYSKAAQDRSKLDVAEVWTRVPLVVFYTIVGSELFEKAFPKILESKKKFPDIVRKTADGKLITPLREELPKLAEKISKERNTDYQKELSRLTREKAFIQGVPYAFSLLFMGFTLSAITRFWTQVRYNRQNKENTKLF